ncbi:MAG: hypothetical protein HY537_06305 [Deltaproteobacteria bacterium]|nr:hypothetical protein [Deltaproteobacteria bacterium]
MELPFKYQAILEKNLEKAIPRWRELSAFDPMKVFAEAVSCSLAEIEKRQRGYTERIMDSVPALFSFSPKKASLPWGWFTLETAPKLAAIQTIGRQHSFRFQSEKEFVMMTPRNELALQPVSAFSTQVVGNSIHCNFVYRGACAEVTLYFVSQGKGSKLRPVELEVQQLASKQIRHWAPTALVTNDTTEHFTQDGSIQIRLKDCAVFSDHAAEYRLKLTFESAVPAGFFHPNLVAGELCEVSEQVELGNLSGEPWEELPLDPRVIEVPNELLLHLPDDRLVKITRLESDLLKLRHVDTERFKYSYFYNGSNHSLIFPLGHELMQNFSGGVAIVAPKLVRSPSVNWLNDQFKYVSGEHAACVEHVTPIVGVGGYNPRESKQDFLKRFYSIQRSLSCSPRDAELRKETLQSTLLSTLSVARRVELDINEEQREVIAYILVDSPEGRNSTLDYDTIDLAVKTLGRLLPMTYRYKVKPFRKIPLDIDLRMAVCLNQQRATIFTQEWLQSRSTEILSKLLLPPPFGMLTDGETFSKKLLWEQLLLALTDGTRDGTALLPSEIMSIEGLIAHGEKSTYVELLSRQAGESFDVRVSPTIQMRLEEVTNVVSFRKKVSNET